MKKLIKLLQKRMYHDIYIQLEGKKYQYTLESLNKDFNDVDELNLYCYLIYVLSKQQTCEMSILICEYLMFLGTPFYDIYPVIRYHLDISLLASPNNLEILNWIASIFFEHPDSPYTDNELLDFAKIIIRAEPDNEQAKKILEKLG